MPNNDRVFELYKGEIYSPESQDKCRTRIHWMCRQVTGNSILDVGCSQGVASILLAREGLHVVGVDLEKPSLDYASAELAKEPPGVQQRVSFQVADAGRLPYPDATFDTALVGELLEHLVQPERVLREVSRVLKPDGRIVITTPLGLLPHPDHKQVFTVSDVLNLLEPLYATVEVELRGKLIHYVGSNRPASSPWLASAKLLGDLLRKLESEYSELDVRSDNWKQRSDRATEALDKARTAYRDANKEIEQLKGKSAPLAAEIQSLRAAQEENTRLLVERARLSSQVERMELLERELHELTRRTEVEQTARVESAQALAVAVARIRELEQSAEERSRSYSELTANAARLETLEQEAIAQASTHVTALEKLLEQKQQLADQNSARIAEFQDQLEARQQELAASRARADEIAQSLEQAQAAANAVAARATELQHLLEAKEQEVATGQASMAEVTELLRQVQADADTRAAELQRLLEQKQLALDASAANEVELWQFLEVLERDGADQIRQLERSLGEREDSLTASHSRIGELSRLLDESQQMLSLASARGAELQRLHTEAQEAANANASSLAELRGLLDTRQQAHSTEVRALGRALEDKHRALDASQARVADNEKALSAKTGELLSTLARATELENRVRENAEALAAHEKKSAVLEGKYASEQAARQRVNDSLQRYTRLAENLKQKLADEQAARRSTNETLQHFRAVADSRKKRLEELITDLDVFKRSGTYRFATRVSAILRLLGYHKLKSVLGTAGEMPRRSSALGETEPKVESSRAPTAVTEHGTVTAAPTDRPSATPGVTSADHATPPSATASSDVSSDPAKAATEDSNGPAETPAMGAATAPLAQTPKVPSPVTPGSPASPTRVPHGAPTAFSWPTDLISRPRDPKELRVAGILDEFSHACFRPECELLSFSPDNWRALFEERRPDLLFVESAWNGNGGAWQYCIASYSHKSYVGLPHLRPLLEWCQTHQVPTVFWNKEDPVHFERFKEAAALFDVILTTDSNCIERYRALPGVRARTIEALPFAAQPLLHHPMSANVERRDEPCFAGTYYRDRHPARQEQLEMILDAARPFGLVIYDRMHGSVAPSVGFPERFAPHVRGGLPYEELVKEYRRHKVFLNANSVVDSPTMFSRRVFELLACGTAVVSTESPGIRKIFGDLVPIVRNQEEARQTIRKLIEDDEYRLRLTSRAVRHVLRDHTYRQRLAAVARAAGFNVDANGDSRVALITLADEVRRLPLLSSVSSQTLPPAEVIIGTRESHDLDEKANELRERIGAETVRVVRLLDEPDDVRYQRLARLASSPWIWPAHSSCSYGPGFLESLVICREFAQADVIGKGVRPGSNGDSARTGGPQHRYVRQVHHAGAIAKRDLVAARGWPASAENGAWMERWSDEGVLFYSADAEDFRPAVESTVSGRAS